MKNITLLICTFLLLSTYSCQGQDEIRIIMRGDDIGSSHAANLGCIQSYQDGIMKSVEVMVPCAWFPEAARMLRENPGLDVGVHLTFTSEWENVKWKPLTHAPGLADENGYFYPMIWPSERRPEAGALKESDWTLEEVEAEMRAQIEMAMKHIPQVSHLSAHMGCQSVSDEVTALYHKLAKEYKLDIDPADYATERLPLKGKGNTTEERVDIFIEALDELEPGKTYLYVEHPALESMEMSAVGHKGYENVNEDRQMVTELFTSDKLKKAIEEKGIKVISYAELAEK